MECLPDLEELWLGCNQLESVSQLSFSKLRTLCLSSNRLESAEGIQKCPSIEECLLDNNRLNNVEQLRECKHIQVVDLSNNNITSIEPISQHRLTDLWISHNPQLDIIPSLVTLAHKDTVESLAVQGCKAPSKETLLRMLTGLFSNLRTLNGDPIKM